MHPQSWFRNRASRASRTLWCCGGLYRQPVTGLRKGDQRAVRFIPELEAHRSQTTSESENRHAIEHRVLVVRLLEVVVRNLCVEMMDVVQADVSGEEPQHLRELEIRAAIERGVDVAPARRLRPVGVLELVLGVEQPDPRRTGEE
jgi:hypothetical protein